MSHIQSKKIIEQPKRFKYAIEQIQKLGFEVKAFETVIVFTFNNKPVNFFPYTGWASGQTIKDGRGIHNLLKQIK